MKPSLLEVSVDIGDLLEKKNAAYGNSFENAENILKVLFPNGVRPEQFKDLLTVTRIVDKLFRIATNKSAFSEDPWKDIAGYAILSLWSHSEHAELPTVAPPVAVPKKKRGRPKKINPVVVPAAPRKRGRPRKNLLPAK